MSCYLHGLDPRVVLCRELFEDEVGVLVDAHEVAGLQLLRLDEPDHGQEVRLPGRRLDHRALACDDSDIIQLALGRSAEHHQSDIALREHKKARLLQAGPSGRGQPFVDIERRVVL